MQPGYFRSAGFYGPSARLQESYWLLLLFHSIRRKTQEDGGRGPSCPSALGEYVFVMAD